MGLDNNISSQPSQRKSPKFWGRLVEPSIALQNSEKRQQARLLSGLIFFLMVFISVGLISSSITRGAEGIAKSYVFMISVLLLLISYVISRTRYYYLAGILALLTMSVFPFGDVLVYQNYENMTTTLMWLILPLILGVVILKPREQVLLVLVDIAGLIALAVILQQSISSLLITGALILTTSGMLMVLEIYRRRIEENRQSELLHSNQQLESIRTSLEDQVAERTKNAEDAKIEVERANRALEMQMWQVSGLAELATVMRGVQSTAELATSIIRHVCYYAKVPVGALFIADRDELCLTGSYAYPFPTNPIPRFKIGTGLVGEAARDQQVITLRDIPENYLPISSGLGEVPPAQIIAVPCIYQDRVVSVMELASLQPFTSAQIQFVTAATESIASALDTSHIRTQIDDLLINSRQKTEELTKQDENEGKGHLELRRRDSSILHNKPQPLKHQNKSKAKRVDMTEKKIPRSALGEVSDDD